MRLITKMLMFCLTLSSLLFASDFRFQEIDVPNSTLTVANGINARGDIVGRYNDAKGVAHGFLLHKGVFSTIDFPHASSTGPRAINARGDIAGRFQYEDGIDHAFLLHDGQFTQIDYPGASATIGRGINNAGDITGNYTDSNDNEIAFVLQDGKFHRVLVDPCSSDVWMAMDNGQVLVGDNCMNPDNALHGFLRDKQGNFHSIDFPGTDIPCTAIRWINEREEIVGLFAYVNTIDECYEPDTTSYHGFLLRRGKYTVIDFPGSSSTQVFAMNDDGQMVGQYRDKNGNVHGFKAVPKDQP